MNATEVSSLLTNALFWVQKTMTTIRSPIWSHLRIAISGSLQPTGHTHEDEVSFPAPWELIPQIDEWEFTASADTNLGLVPFGREAQLIY